MVLMVAGLFSNTWLTMVGVIIFSAAQLEERAVIFQSVLDNVRLEEVMLTDFATLSPADTLQDALDKAVHSLQDDFPVVRSVGKTISRGRRGVPTVPPPAPEWRADFSPLHLWNWKSK